MGINVLKAPNDTPSNDDDFEFFGVSREQVTFLAYDLFWDV
jgi:hypothetical protein